MGAEKVEKESCQKTVKNTNKPDKANDDITLSECVKKLTQVQSDADKKLEEILAMCANR